VVSARRDDAGRAIFILVPHMHVIRIYDPATSSLSR
jgi:hypothetical protein